MTAIGWIFRLELFGKSRGFPPTPKKLNFLQGGQQQLRRGTDGRVETEDRGLIAVEDLVTSRGELTRELNQGADQTRARSMDRGLTSGGLIQHCFLQHGEKGSCGSSLAKGGLHGVNA